MVQQEKQEDLNMSSNNMEKIIEQGLFASRWLMAPFYIGLVGALVVLLCSFTQELWHFVLSIPHLKQTDAVLGVLSLIDLSLAGNLLVIVTFSGYENFVSKIDIAGGKDKQDWHGTVDFAALKLKLVASIVAISGIHLLKVFMEVDKTSEQQIKWMIIIHLVFVVSGVLLALMDYIAAGTKKKKK
jgi:uncharacterized protein (TIGR00645 family)